MYFSSENTKFISSRELKTSEFTLVLRTRENSDVFNTLDEICIWHSPQKSKCPLSITVCSLLFCCRVRYFVYGHSFVVCLLVSYLA